MSTYVQQRSGDADRSVVHDVLAMRAASAERRHERMQRCCFDGNGVVPDDDREACHEAGTCTRALMCFRFATMVNVMMTSSDQALHLLTWTTDHAPSWFG